MLMGARLIEFGGTVLDKIVGLTDCHLGTSKFLVCSLNILNKSDKHLSITGIFTFS